MRSSGHGNRINTSTSLVQGLPDTVDKYGMSFVSLDKEFESKTQTWCKIYGNYLKIQFRSSRSVKIFQREKNERRERKYSKSNISVVRNRRCEKKRKNGDSEIKSYLRHKPY